MLVAVSLDQILSYIFVITGLMYMAVVTKLNLIQYNFGCAKYMTWHSLLRVYFSENIFKVEIFVSL